MSSEDRVVTPMELDDSATSGKKDNSQLPWVEKYRPQR
jgi:hypothetical protein